MANENGRYQAVTPVQLAEGWRCERRTPPSRLFGANGVRTGQDGRIYVAQVSGSQISAINADTGVVETISPKGGDIIAPDDIVFDPDGNLFATEITEGRVSMRRPNGETRVIWGDMPCANPITWHDGRLLAGECRPGGRIMELDLNGGPPRIILDNVPMPNAMEVGPDGKLYIPIMGTNEIWRVGLDGGEPEVVARDLGVPDSLKFAPDGSIVSTQVASGQVLRIDPQSGAQTVLANIAPGLDNVTFVGERIFVSSISGQVNEVLAGGAVRNVVPDGFNWPLGLAMGADGVLFVADGPYSYWLRPDGSREVAGMLFTPGIPGYCRGAAMSGPGEVIVTTSVGTVARWRPAAQEHDMLAAGFDQLYGVAVSGDGRVVFAETGAGCVHGVSGEQTERLAEGLNQPKGVTISDQGAVYVSETGGGRVVLLSRGGSETVVDGLRAPEGVLALGDTLYIVDAGAQELVAFNTSRGERRTIASGLPVGAPPGVAPKFLNAIGDMSGPMGPFAAITADSAGRLYVSGDAEGSVLTLFPEQ